MKTPAFVAFAVLLVAPVSAGAQQMTLQIENGLVTLDAHEVSVRQILAEWARIGGARIVNGEKVAGGPVTLQLRGIPERQALDTILRGVSGYMLASRQAGTTGVSGFDRILILPTSTAPRGNPAPGNAAFPGMRPMPVQPVQPVEAEELFADDDRDEPDGDIDGDGEEVVQPQPGMNPRFQRRPTAQGQPFVPGAFPAPPQVDEDAAPAPAPTNPFGAPGGGSATPGVISPVPQDPQQPPTRRPPA
ncbi:MAG: hypothetical protein ACRD26_16870 [Vicinamibacterales bacterium]